MFVLVYLLSVIIAKCVYATFSFTETALQCFICRAVMESISPKHCMSEDKARHHFVDLILGLEYCEYITSLEQYKSITNAPFVL